MLSALAAAVPAAEAVHVVNNNAAALVLAATALAAGREIVVSRGELIEIGDGFRLPALLESTGARIREVGTTNRTTAGDYAEAVGPQTGFVLKVHPSNYRIEGFTASASVADLALLGVPVIGDIGSGLLAPHPLLPDEPDAASWLSAGAALVTASGDKLLGGPQAGLLLGRGDLVTRLARHPLARALRIDKLTAAALEATLTGPPPPVTEALAPTRPAWPSGPSGSPATLAAAGIDAACRGGAAAVGGGGAPGVDLASAAVSLPAGLAAPLRAGGAVRRGRMPAVVGRIEDGRLLLDLRAVAPADDDLLRGRSRGGRLGGRAMQVIATAGHVDHGKSALIRALTGMDPDRWAEERRRGMTIDLGFAWLTLPSGEQLAFVDVPGHERFVPNMLAGVGPVPAVLFVVAADEGWMPQSAEHLAVVDALGISTACSSSPGPTWPTPAPRSPRPAPRSPQQPGRRRPPSPSARSTGAGLPELVAALDLLSPAPAGARPGRAGPDLDRPGVHHDRQRHGRHRHAAGRHRAPRRRAGADARRCARSGSAASSRWARRAPRPPASPGSRSTCAASARSTWAAAWRWCRPAGGPRPT